RPSLTPRRSRAPASWSVGNPPRCSCSTTRSRMSWRRKPPDGTRRSLPRRPTSKPRSPDWGCEPLSWDCTTRPLGGHVPALDSVLAIELPFDPNIVEIGGFLLTWHGLFTAVGILVGVRLSLWIAGRIGFNVDDAYTLALIGIPSGIIGARLLFVAEPWEFYGDNLGDILALTEGGISSWGAVLGGVAGPLAFALWRGWDIWKGLDSASVGLIAGMGIGRIGDLINGEHLARATDLPWGVIYTDPDSPAFAHLLTVRAHHPATTYDMLSDHVLLDASLLLPRWPFRRRHGLTNCADLASD